MKTELIIFAITVFFIVNTYHDGKYLKIMKTWKKYYQMAGIGFVGLSAYIFLRKNPSQSHSLITHANGLIKYLPIDKESGDMLSPLLNMTNKGGMLSSMGGGGGSGGANMQRANSPENIILNSGKNSNMQNGKISKRSVSETKKKYVAAQQGWNCGGCKKQLPAWFEVDHKIRLDNGGSNHVDNLVALCRDCHGKKTAFENL